MQRNTSHGSYKPFKYVAICPGGQVETEARSTSSNISQKIFALPVQMLRQVSDFTVFPLRTIHSEEIKVSTGTPICRTKGRTKSRTIAGQLSGSCPALSGSCPAFVRQLSGTCPAVVRQAKTLKKNYEKPWFLKVLACRTTPGQVPDNCRTKAGQVPDNCPAIVRLIWGPFWGP